MRHSNVGMLLLFGVLVTAHAHDPGLSTADVSLEADAVRVKLVVSRSELRSLLPGPPAGVGESAADPRLSGLSSLAAESVALRSLRDAIGARAVKVRKPSGEEILFELEYPRPPGSLTLEFPILAMLTRGHRLLVSVRGQGDSRPERRLLGGKTASLFVNSGIPAISTSHEAGRMDEILF